MADHFDDIVKERLKRLKIKAREKGLSLQDISDRTGVDPSQVSKWLNGRWVPGQANYLKLADAIEKGLEF